MPAFAGMTRGSSSRTSSRFGTTPDVIRQANNIPASSGVRAGSTILVPKTSATMHTDIADHVVDNAVLALQAERTASYSRPRRGDKLSNAQRLKAKVAELSSRVGKRSVKSAAVNSRRKVRNG